MPRSKTIPFYFVIDYLMPLEPRVKPMFGCHAIYVAEKIVFILRDRETFQECNGVWLATSHEHHKSLKKEFPSLCTISVLNEGAATETGWQMLPAEADDFEPSVIRACQLVLHDDARIGKIPQPRKKKKKI